MAYKIKMWFNLLVNMTYADCVSAWFVRPQIKLTREFSENISQNKQSQAKQFNGMVRTMYEVDVNDVEVSLGVTGGLSGKLTDICCLRIQSCSCSSQIFFTSSSLCLWLSYLGAVISSCMSLLTPSLC